MIRVDSTTVQLVTAIAAAIAALAGPCVARAIAKQQILASAKAAQEQIRASEQTARARIWADTVSVGRLEWNERLRNSLAELVSDLMFYEARIRSTPPMDEAAVDQILSRMNQKIVTVRLLLNLAEPAHEKLWNGVSRVLVKREKEAPEKIEGTDVAALVNHIFDQGAYVLKIEWEKIKKDAGVTGAV